MIGKVLAPVKPSGCDRRARRLCDKVAQRRAWGEICREGRWEARGGSIMCQSAARGARHSQDENSGRFGGDKQMRRTVWNGRRFRNEAICSLRRDEDMKKK